MEKTLGLSMNDLASFCTRGHQFLGHSLLP
jgi:hypothetical protein